MKVTVREPHADGEGSTYYEVDIELPEGWRDTARVVARATCAPSEGDEGAHEPWYGEPDEHDIGKSTWWDRDDNG